MSEVYKFLLALPVVAVGLFVVNCVFHKVYDGTWRFWE